MAIGVNRAMDLLELARYWAGVRERAPIGTPEARIEVLTSRGKRVLTPTTNGARSDDTPGRLNGGDSSDDRTV